MSNIEDALYADPRLVGIYDLLNSGDSDFKFYLDRLGKENRRVLDLGCGTGTFALRLAAIGHAVVAVDPSPMMVNYAKHRPGSGSIEWIVGDALSPRIRKPFEVATMTGHAFQCLLVDNEMRATLRAVYAALGAGGRFMFETRNPTVQPWTTWNPVCSARSIQSEQYGPVDVFHQCNAVAEPLVEFETHYVFRRDNTRLLSRSKLRFMSAGELATELNAAGFRDIEWFGDWTGTPFHETSSAEIIAICHA
ncbi:class I SAM-dependent methyltransferase [Paraburkholderia antibiotica]|uniref:Class I SAM-dependent methyltransferase n=1 Tax=Paraburkholderia antibiotica TaxID=2728839 RepID=A0A7X9X4M6_9BURK|nr:class I SAM-dependent methyltransferase [Paraburkholderia antibiotica]NML31335.1 class I SAM-dependent methyltransferase [Paraburkholderia antibiotica]